MVLKIGYDLTDIFTVELEDPSFDGIVVAERNGVFMSKEDGPTVLGLDGLDVLDVFLASPAPIELIPLPMEESVQLQKDYSGPIVIGASDNIIITWG